MNVRFPDGAALALICVAAVVVAAGCFGGGGSATESALGPGAGSALEYRSPVSPSVARREAGETRREWLAEIRSRGRRARTRRAPARFPSPGAKVFAARLQTAA